MSTIEKALQKQREAQAAKKQAQVPSEETSTDTSPAVEQNTLERAAEVTPSAEPDVTVQPTAPAPAVSSTERVPKVLELNLNREGFVTETGRNVLNEEYRAIKRKVLSNAFGPLSKTLDNSNIIMVTSPNPNEGKTFTAANLALSIALERDKTVLLVDADVLRPSVMNAFGQKFNDGLMEYLLGEIEDVGEVIYHTQLETLRVIPAGKSHHLSSELLASQRMFDLVSEFATRYPDRVVIFDTPPLLGINETAILANLAGQAIVVVEEGKTNLTRVSKAVEQLNPDMAKGFVVNKARINKNDVTGYYGYYYGHKEEE